MVLGCVFSPDFGPNPNISSLVVTWQRVENNHVVHSFYYERDQLDLQDSAYQKRTSLFVNKLSKGNASVRIENVGVKDAGRYLCTVSTSRGTDKASLQLDYGGKRRLLIFLILNLYEWFKNYLVHAWLLFYYFHYFMCCGLGKPFTLSDIDIFC